MCLSYLFVHLSLNVDWFPCHVQEVRACSSVSKDCCGSEIERLERELLSL